MRRCSPVPVWSRLHVHEPQTAARDGLAADVDDKADKTTRFHASAGPATVHAVRGVEVLVWNDCDCFPHPTTVADEELQIRDGCLANDGTCHMRRIRATDLLVWAEVVNLKQG